MANGADIPFVPKPKNRYPRPGTQVLSIASRKVALCRLFVADSDPLARAAVAQMVEGHPLIRLADELSSREELVAEVTRQPAEVILIDLALPPNGGLDALRRVKEADAGAKVVLMGEAMDDWAISEAIRLGARGALSKDAARQMLLACVSEVYAGHFWVERQAGQNSARILQENIAPVRSSAGARLSQREKQVIGFILEGCTNRQIAETIQTSEQVVKNHLSRIFDKVGVYNRLELALYALNHRLLSSGPPPQEKTLH